MTNILLLIIIAILLLTYVLLASLILDYIHMFCHIFSIAHKDEHMKFYNWWMEGKNK